MSGWISSTGWAGDLSSPGPIGNVTPSTGKFTTLTATQDVVIATAGNGIDFSAVTPAPGMTSQLLTDYEEGVFTPAMYFGGVEIESYNAQNGWYTKIGNNVTYTIFIQLRTKGAATGAVTVGGLPYTSKNNNSRKYAINVVGQALSGLTGALFGVLNENTTVMQLYQSASNGGAALTDAVFADYSSNNVIITGSYQV